MVRRIRLLSGLALFAFVATHLLNHALGLISLEAMEAGRAWFLALWRNPAGTALLYGALLAHFALAVWAVYDRRRLLAPRSELFQLLLGAAIPLLLALHVLGTRGAAELGGTNDSYAYVLLVHWTLSPRLILYQSAALLAAWVHGCMGLHFWLRLRPGYARVRWALFSLALLLPVLALLGYAQAGREVVALARDPEWMRAALAVIHWPPKDVGRTILALTDAVWYVTLGAFALALLGRAARAAAGRARGTIRITYPGGATLAVPPGGTILDASRAGALPHASVCGGRGRCSTCRVRIVRGADALPAPSPQERRVLERIGSPIHVRLACQVRPRGDVEAVPLLPPDATAHDARSRAGYRQGQERVIAVLFSDIRSFTKFSEKRLPYDVVFVLNQYFAAMGRALEATGGYLDKFIGDGIMVLFGVETPPAEACLQSLRAARAMAERLGELNRTLAGELSEPLRIGIGIHAGAAIVGEMGFGRAARLTAIGDTVNTASRLEAMTKGLGVQLVVSEDVAAQAGVDLSGFPAEEITVRGRSAPVRVRIVESAADLPL